MTDEEATGAKRATHAENYGMGEVGIALMTGQYPTGRWSTLKNRSKEPKEFSTASAASVITQGRGW